MSLDLALALLLAAAPPAPLADTLRYVVLIQQKQAGQQLVVRGRDGVTRVEAVRFFNEFYVLYNSVFYFHINFNNAAGKPLFVIKAVFRGETEVPFPSVIF
jgi:hypothetical protein